MALNQWQNSLQLPYLYEISVHNSRYSLCPQTGPYSFLRDFRQSTRRLLWPSTRTSSATAVVGPSAQTGPDESAIWQAELLLAPCTAPPPRQAPGLQETLQGNGGRGQQQRFYRDSERGALWSNAQKRAQVSDQADSSD